MEEQLLKCEMSKATNHIIVPIKAPKSFKQMRLPGSYIANLYNQFAIKLGSGRHVHVEVDPSHNSKVRIGYIELDVPPEKGKKYMIEIKLDDGNLYLECRAESHQAQGKGYSLLLISNQPPRTWLSK